jgi:hypothetical protein
VGKKNSRAGQATDDNMAHVQCMVDTKDYKQTIRICINYFFSTAKMVAPTPLNVTLYVLSCVVRTKIDGVCSKLRLTN